MRHTRYTNLEEKKTDGIRAKLTLFHHAKSLQNSAVKRRGCSGKLNAHTRSIIRRKKDRLGGPY